MKRFLCPQHINHLKKDGKSILLSSEKCGVCKWKKRPTSLKDTANQLENIAGDMRIVYDDPYYDPHGITFLWQFAEVINKFLKSINIGYRKNFIEALTKDVELEFDKVVFKSTYKAN